MTNNERIQANNAELREAIEMAENLPDAGGGGTPTPTQEKTVNITANGTHTVTPDEGYALSKVTANVNVPIPEGYIKPSGTKEITENGAHSVTEYDSVSVVVPIPDGYIQPSGTLDVTENGTHDVTAYASVDVNVEASGGEDHLDDFLVNTLTAIDSDVTKIVSYGSYGRTALKTANLPKCTNIGSYAFRGCTGITNFDAPLVTTIDTYAFYGCSKLTDINMPKATTIGTYAFYKCDLRNVNFPVATGISQNAFYQNENLQIADFGVASKINQAAFANCESLVALILRRTSSICALGVATNGFSGTPIAEGTGYVYVPSALIEEYKVATNWSGYASQFRALESYTVDGTTTGELDENKIKNSPGKTYAGYEVTSKSGDWTLDVYDNGTTLQVSVELYHPDVWYTDEGEETNYEIFNVVYNVERDSNGYVVALPEEFSEWLSYVCCISLTLDTSQLATTGKAYISAGCGNCENTVGVAEYLNAEIRFT